MEISLLLMQQIAQLFLILIMGYAVVKVGLLKASDSRVLSVVMVYLVTPCVIINAFQIDDTPEIRKGLLYSMAIAAAIHVVLLVLSALLSRPLKLDAVEQVNVIYSNAAALVIPLVKALMGDAYVIYSCAFIIVQLVLLWTHASSLLQGSSALDWKKVLTNINMIAIAAGALLYWFRVVLPAPLQNTMSTVGNMMGPMGMLLAGMAIAEKPLREVFCTRRNYTENGRICNENCGTALRQDGLCTRERQRILLTTKVHLAEAPLFFDQICAIIQKQRFARPRKGQGRAERKTRSLESWKEKN